MENDVEHKIRKRAYDLWVQDGQVPGRSDDYWLQAEREILGTPNEGDLPGSQAAPTGDAVAEVTSKPARKTVPRAAAPKAPKAAGNARSKRVP
jgi:hypothetical protein